MFSNRRTRRTSREKRVLALFKRSGLTERHWIDTDFTYDILAQLAFHHHTLPGGCISRVVNYSPRLENEIAHSMEKRIALVDFDSANARESVRHIERRSSVHAEASDLLLTFWDFLLSLLVVFMIVMVG